MTDSSTDEVIYDVEPSGVAWLVLNRPDVGNALTREQRRRIQDRLEEAGDDLGVRAIVLTGSGDRHFCTGGDLRVAALATAPQAAAAKPADAPDKPVGTVMRGLESERGAAFRAEALALEVSMQAVDSNEGVRAFVERRLAEFLGW